MDVIDAVSGLEAATSLGVLRLLASKDCLVHERTHAYQGHCGRRCPCMPEDIREQVSQPVASQDRLPTGLHPYKLLNLDVFSTAFFTVDKSDWAISFAEVKGRLRAACATKLYVTNGAIRS